MFLLATLLFVKEELKSIQVKMLVLDLMILFMQKLRVLLSLNRTDVIEKKLAFTLSKY